MKGKGYKVFNSDWSCRGFQYKVGETYEMNERPILCEQGFHFCRDLKDCFRYYPLSDNIKIAEIEVLGEIDGIASYDTKRCTNKIKIVREIPFDQLFTKIKTIECWTVSMANFEIGEKTSCRTCGKYIVFDGYCTVINKKIKTYVNNHRFFLEKEYLVKFKALLDVKEIYNERL